MISSITASDSGRVLDVGMMLRRQHDGIDFLRAPVYVLDRDLRLRIRAQPFELALVAQLRLTFDQAVRKVDRQRHQVRRFIACVAEHQALVACTLIQIQTAPFIDALGDIGRLLVVGDEHGATAIVDAVVGIVVADPLDCLARNRLVVDDRFRGDFTRQDNEPGVTQCLGSHARVFVLREDRVEDGVRDLVGYFVRMTFRHRLRRKEEAAAAHEYVLKYFLSLNDALRIPNDVYARRRVSVRPKLS